ncbi:uncharacterized protein K489DRAFT_185930 [Dissoconium aciculare CBS 342.82]|jgi:pyrimidine deaminase RibD-like protein|uniref:CMP/dCMP-type deaminase domain-containing protein n=1 Tax=Dissoconium aciculare CBS 342.82 TaxID=1314786 RepID=A0A6J3M987_9PEZI|nr:uncharacterized protein K489DRAFT_185930 [Dissoconium aciculare CBS 342.82]KAF1824611.1 hypothetical protein K489DRAFT_185930 [Dissoconium aciculare CBS 342.82]
MSLEERTSPLHFMRLALTEAGRSPPKPTNFCVGACLVAHDSSPAAEVLTTGYTLECAGNTHAEQSCFIKLAQRYGCSVDVLGEKLAREFQTSAQQRASGDTDDGSSAEGLLALYTTMEPCNRRSAGNTPCVDRILALARADGTPVIRRVYVGVSEPETFVGVNLGRRRLTEAGIEVVHVAGLEEAILQVATAGHERKEEGS